MANESVNPTLVELQIDRTRVKRADLDLSADDEVQEVAALAVAKAIRVLFLHLEPADGATIVFYTDDDAIPGTTFARAQNQFAGGLTLFETVEGEALGALVSGGATTGYILYIES